MTWREFAVRAAAALRLGSRARERDLAEELRFHEEMLEEHHRERGDDPAAARRAARLDLGGQAQIAEAWRDQRSLPVVETLVQDVGYGLRMLRRTPGFTAAALLTLALGIGANTAMFTIVNAVLLQPLPYVEPDRLVTVGDRTPAGYSSNVGFATLIDWRARSRSFEQLALMRSWQPTLVVNGEAERLPAVRVSWNYFPMMGVRPALGRGFTEADDHPNTWRVLLLSDGLWRRRFNADPSVVGRTITMNDRGYRILGVMPAGFEPLDAIQYYRVAAEMWAPLGYELGGDSACRSCQHLRAFGRLARGVSVDHATAELNVIREAMRREHPRDYENGSIAVVPLRDALTGRVRTALLVLLGAVGFVLLIACANVANLLLARSVARQRELTLRRVLGASRARIARQLLTESLMLSIAGAMLGLGLAAIGVRGLAAFAAVSLPRVDAVAIDARVLTFTAIVAVATGVLFGLVPAWRGASDASQTLAVDSRASVGGSGSARAALVIADLVLALVLLAGAGLMLRTMASLTRTSPGFTADGILTLQFSLVGKAYAEDPAVVAFQNRMLERLRALPGVENVALADQVPFGGDYDCRGFHVQGRMKANTVDDPCIERYGVTPDYARVMGIPLRRGRFISAEDTSTAQFAVVVSESTAKLIWGMDDPIGSQVRIGDAATGPWYTVVGVVGDVHHEDLTQPVTAAMYTAEAQFTDSFLVAIVKGSAGRNPAAQTTAVRQVLRELDASVPVYDIATLPALVERASAQRLFVMRLLGGFAGVAVLLAAIGLYGVVSYGVAQRTREVAVRVALGAQRRDVLGLVLRGGLALAGIGVAIGILSAVATTRFLGTLIFGVSPVDPPTFLGAAALLAFVALAAHVVPIRRALRIDPAQALRAE